MSHLCRERQNSIAQPQNKEIQHTKLPTKPQPYSTPQQSTTQHITIQHFPPKHQKVQDIMSFVTDVMSPGGGVMLLPFVRLVIGCLLLLTMGTFLAGVAQIHMAILTVLGGGLLFSLSFFESEYKKVQSRVQKDAPPMPSGSTTTTASSSNTAKKQVAKTD